MSKMSLVPDSAIVLTLFENPLNDDSFVILPPTHRFVDSRGGYKYGLQYWTFASAWSDDEHWLFSNSPKHLLGLYEKVTGRKAYDGALGDIEANIAFAPKSSKKVKKVIDIK